MSMTSLMIRETQPTFFFFFFGREKILNLSWTLDLLGASMIAQLVKIHLQCRRPQFNSWVRKIHWRMDSLPTPVFLGSPCGSAGKESACNAGDLGSIPGMRRSPGDGKGYSFQYSGLENYTVWRTIQSMGSQRVGHDRVTLTSLRFTLGYTEVSWFDPSNPTQPPLKLPPTVLQADFTINWPSNILPSRVTIKGTNFECLHAQYYAGALPVDTHNSLMRHKFLALISNKETEW